MYAIGEEIHVPDISNYFMVTIASEAVITPKSRSRVITIFDDINTLFITKPETWHGFRTGEYPRNFASFMHDYAVYEVSDGVLIPVNKVILTNVALDSVTDRATTLISTHKLRNAIVLTTADLLCVIEPAPLRYLCFKVVPKGRRIKRVEEVVVDYFWEITSIALTSDRKTTFDVKMKV